jgi:hypothetical protein
MTATLGVTRQKVAGDAVACGRALGVAGRAAVAQIVSQSRLWHRVTAPDMAPAVRRMADATRALFPDIHAEITALADGLELPFDPVFAWNARGDLLSGLGDGCTTVQLPGDEPVVAHNEDGMPGLSGHCFITDLRADNAPIAMSFCYPGSIPGHSFAVTAAGLVITVNNLRLVGITPEIPRMVLTRALLAKPDRNAMVELLRNAPSSGGFHLSIAQVGASDIWSVSFGGGEVHAVEHTRHALHSNHAQVSGPVMSRQTITASSRDRLRRGLDLIEQGASPLSILNDTGGAGLPIFRTAPDDPDDENTLAHFHARLTPTGIDWRVHAPGNSVPAHTGFMPAPQRLVDA